MSSSQDSELDLQSYNKCKEIVSSLPSHESSIAGLLRCYRGFYLQEQLLVQYLWCQQNFKATPTDILLVTYPKSGTTWLKAMTFAILHRGPVVTNIFADHPLLAVHPQESLPHLEALFSGTCQVPSDQFLSALPSPRVFSAHIPYSILPPSAKDNARIVYLCRDPKDVVISLWHFLCMVERRGKNNLTCLDELVDQFCDGRVYAGSAWDHRMEYWKESLSSPDKVLFLEYEDMLKRPEANARRLAEFIGRPFSEEEEKHGVVADIVKLCSIDFLKGLEVNKEGFVEAVDWSIRKSSFFRNGKAGGGKEELSREAVERMDKITEEYYSKLSYHKVAMEN